MNGVNPNIFREYDIRGIAGEDLTPAVAEIIGRGYGTYLRNKGGKRVVIGRDCRLSSPELHKALTTGVRSTGCDVIDIGVCPTPLMYFAIIHLNTDGGLQVTGSHNPPQYNGFKVCVGRSAIFGEQIQQLKKICESGEFAKGEGSLSNYKIIPPYQEWVKNNIDIQRPIRMVLDAGNGTAGVVAAPIFRHFRCEVTELYCEMDGTFPHHHPDPTLVSAMQDLINEVINTGAEVGIAYDGDGDRIGVVDEKGNMIWGDQLMIIFSREILSRKPGASIISEVKSSQNLFDDIKKHGGRPIMWKTGHSLIKQKMKEEKAELAGEMSGHIFFSDRFFGHDDAIYASCRLLEILSRTDKTLSELLADVPKMYSTPEIRVECPDEEKFEIVKKAQDYFGKRYKITSIDGARILFGDGWGLLRASNTQPMLVLRFEAKTPERLEEIKRIVEEGLDKIRSGIA